MTKRVNQNALIAETEVEVELELEVELPYIEINQKFELTNLRNCT